MEIKETNVAKEDIPVTKNSLRESVRKELLEFFVEAGITEEETVRIEEYGFFVAPASSKYHLCKPGGLAEHSLNVIKTALLINDTMALGLERVDIIRASTFHDMGKSKRYAPNILKSGLQSSAIPYNCESDLTLPDCSDSLYAVLNDLGIKMNPLVAIGVMYQNGAFDYSFKQNVKSIAKNQDHMKMAWLIHSADMYSAWITERKDAKKSSSD